MKKITVIIVSLFLISSLYAQTSIEGLWNTGDENTIVETYQEDGLWYGKVVSSDNPKAEIGKEILKGFKNDGEVLKGKVYSPRQDKNYKATIKPKEEALEIVVSVAFFSKTLNWAKVK